MIGPPIVDEIALLVHALEVHVKTLLQQVVYDKQHRQHHQHQYKDQNQREEDLPCDEPNYIFAVNINGNVMVGAALAGWRSRCPGLGVLLLLLSLMFYIQHQKGVLVLPI